MEKRIAATWFDTKEITRLREKSQAYSSKEDLWSWYVLRRLSIFVTILFMKLRLSPNSISWMSALFVVFSGFWLLQATPISFILAFFCYNIGYLLDCVDGEVARLTGKTSKKGYFIDLLIQGATLPVFLAMPFALLVLWDRLLLSPLELGVLYLVVTLVIMALFVPIAYQLTNANQVNERDPVNKIRTKSFVFELAGVLLGLPGFFLVLFLLTLGTFITGFFIQPLYMAMFLLIMVLKVALRFVITVRSF